MFADIKLRVDKLAMCNLPLEETEIVFSTQKRLKVYKEKKTSFTDIFCINFHDNLLFACGYDLCTFFLYYTAYALMEQSSLTNHYRKKAKVQEQTSMQQMRRQIPKKQAFKIMVIYILWAQHRLIHKGFVNTWRI